VPSGTVAASRVRADEESDRPATNEHINKTARHVEHGSTGLPVGVQVLALPGRDDVCLAAMQALEAHFANEPDYPPRTPRGLAAM
jgi:fatty acid amide hydrolase